MPALRRAAPVAVLPAAILLSAVSALGAAQTVQQSQLTSTHNASFFRREAHSTRIEIEPLVGEREIYKVHRGDTLYHISRAHDVGVPELMAANGLRSSLLRSGQRLVLPTLHILPMDPADGIVLNVPERALYMLRNGKVEARYACAVGLRDWQTALGRYHVADKLVNPAWRPTKNMVERQNIPDETVPPGPNNPLGDRWMGWSEPGFGFHSTNEPRSVGRVTSHGCVRLYPDAARALFDQVRVGTPIYSVYRPALLGQRGGQIYLSVFPDIYATGLASPQRVQRLLDGAGLGPLMSRAQIARLLRRHDGYPSRILGAGGSLTIDGARLQAAVAPATVNGRWIVPLRAAVEAFGGILTTGPDDTVAVAGNGHTLLLKPGSRVAKLDATSLDLPVAPTIVMNTLLAPVAQLLRVFDASAAPAPGGGLAVTTHAGSAQPAPAIH